VRRYDLVDKIDETCCCDRLFVHVVVISYLYRFGSWLMHLFMVQIEVQFYVWYMLAQIIGTCCLQFIDTG
jgi:hypothetical protein